MIDIHCHLLRGVDDGPEDWDEAVRMCAMAARDGIETAIVTPHQRHERWENRDRDNLQRKVEELEERTNGRPKLLLGAEIAVDSQLFEDVDSLPGGSLLPLSGSRYLLIEFPFVPTGLDPRAVVHELSIAGWRPVSPIRNASPGSATI